MAGNYNAPTNFGIPTAPPPETPPEVYGQFQQVYSAIQSLIRTFIDSCGISSKSAADQISYDANPSSVLLENMGRFYIMAGEALNYGELVTFYKAGNRIKAKRADATDNTKWCDAVCTNPRGIQLGEVGEVNVVAAVINTSGLTPAARYYLSTSPGRITATAPTGGGNLKQYVGQAISSNSLFVRIQTPINF